MRFDKQKLEPFAMAGVKIGLTQLRLNYKRLGNVWQRVLEEMVGRVVV
jgi:hypothetical protein